MYNLGWVVYVTTVWFPSTTFYHTAFHAFVWCWEKTPHTHTSTHTIRTGIEVNANEAVGFCELCLCHSCSMHTVLCDTGWFIALSSTCMQNALTEFPSNRLEAHLHSSIESYAYWACIPFPKLDWFNGNGEHVNRNDCWWHVRQNMSERFSRQVKKKKTTRQQKKNGRIHWKNYSSTATRAKRKGKGGGEGGAWEGVRGLWGKAICIACIRSDKSQTEKVLRATNMCLCVSSLLVFAWTLCLHCQSFLWK